MTDQTDNQIVLHGIGGSPGICIGKAYLVDREGVEVVKQYHLPAGEVPTEIARFKTAVKAAKDELHAIIEASPAEVRPHATILETHMVLLKDKMLYGRTIDLINARRINAEWALKKIVAQVKTMFRGMADDYLKDRAVDIGHVADRIMRNLVGDDEVDISSIDKRVILVAHDLSPSETAQIQLERIKGFVTDRGARTSHTSIIARTLQIPAVLGLGNATQAINNDDLLILDGSRGQVVVNPSESVLLEYEERRIRYERSMRRISRHSHLPAKTLDAFPMKVMGNIELPEEVVSVLDHGGDGIGLYRTEFQYLGRPMFPGEEELYDKYKDVVEVVAPKPVTIRTLDINGDKALAFSSISEEANPALGLRAIRYCLKKPDIFKTQLRAILRAAVHGPVRVMFPMISSYEEVEQGLRMMDQAAEELVKEGMPCNRDVEVGVMIEVPSAAIIADHLAELSDFFSIGTNDLIQYSMAIDRGNREVAHLYSSLHPAILRLIDRVADVCREKQVRLYMCGEMAADPIHVPILLGLGLDELSANPTAIPAVKRMIRTVDLKECEAFTREAMTLKTAGAIARLVEETYRPVLTEKVYDQ